MLIMIPLLFSIIFSMFKEKNSNFILLIAIYYYLLLLNNSLNFSMEIFISMLLSIIMSIWIFNNNENNLLGQLFLISSYLALNSTSIISLFISIEILSMTVLIIINLYIQDKYSGILYYLFSSLISALFLLSLSYYYWGFIFANKLLMISFIGKIGLMPFHLLLPNIYNNLSPKVMLLIDMPYKIVLFYILYRLKLIQYDLNILILLNLLMGSLGTLSYKNLWYILIYSSLFNYGLILMTLNYNKLDYLIYFLSYYSFTMMMFLFLMTSKMINVNLNLNMMLNKFYFMLWFILLINWLGMPPVNGFFIKFMVLYLSIYNNSILFFVISSLGMLFLTFTYLRLLINMIINNNNSNSNNIKYKLHFKSNSYLISLMTVMSFIPLFF